MTDFKDLKKAFVGLDDKIDSIQESLIAFQKPNIAALGVPGTAKTRLMQAVGRMISHDAVFYDGELTATSTPSHIIGPQSFPRLMEAEELVHKSDGFPVDCEIWHAEEGFKASGHLLDLLLSFGEEDRKYMNGKRKCHAKTHVWLVSSNELPNEANGALCDRFSIIFFPRLDNIVDRFSYSSRISGRNYNVLESVEPNPKWSVKRIEMIHQLVKNVEIPRHTMMMWEHIMEGIRKNLDRDGNSVRASAEEISYRGNMQERGSATMRGWRLGLMLAKARAFIEMSRYVEPQHLCAALPVLVVDPDFLDGVKSVLHSWAIPNLDQCSDAVNACEQAFKEADNLIKKEFVNKCSKDGYMSGMDAPIEGSVIRDCKKALRDAQRKVLGTSSIYKINRRLARDSSGGFSYDENRTEKLPHEGVYISEKINRYTDYIEGMYARSLEIGGA